MKAHTLDTLAPRLTSDLYTPALVFTKSGRSWVAGVCVQHGEVETLTKYALQGKPCPTCAKANQGVRPEGRLTLADYEARGRAVHGDRYQYLEVLQVPGKATSLRLACPEHGEFTVTAPNHTKGVTCKRCADSARGENRRFSEAEIKDRIAAVHGDSLTYVSHDYSEGKLKVLLNCPKHGVLIKRGGDYYAHGCAGCSTNVVRISRPAREIAVYMQSLGCKVVEEFYVSGKYSFDMLVDDHLLIEFNGNYWHSSEYRPNNSHRDKQLLGEAAGSRVIQIFSDEWELRKEQVLAILENAAGRRLKGVAARKCRIAEVDSATAHKFLDTYHIQGKTFGCEHIGLYHGEELIAVAAYGAALGKDRTLTDAIELRRYATKIQVVGGLGKVTKFLLSKAPQVVSFSDRRLFTGEAYEKAGYKKAYELPPDYQYLEKDRRYHKVGYQKSRLVKRFGAEFCGTLTEREITEKAGIYRVYDAGKVKWIAGSSKV